MVGHSPDHHQLGEHLYHIGRPFAVTSPDRQIFPGVFVHDRQQRHPSAAMEPYLHEVVGPDVVLQLRPQPHTGAVTQPQPSSPWLLRRHLQPLPSPYPLDPLVVHNPATMSQKGGDPPGAVPAKPTGQLHDLPGQRRHTGGDVKGSDGSLRRRPQYLVAQRQVGHRSLQAAVL